MKKRQSHDVGFILVDVAAVELSLLCTQLLCTFVLGMKSPRIWHLGAMIPLVYFALYNFSLPYEGVLQRGYLRELGALFRLECQTFFILIFLFFFLELPPQTSQRVLGVYFIINFIITYTLRFLHKFNVKRLYNRERVMSHIMVATTESAARSMVHTVTQSAVRNYQFFGLAVLDRDMVGESIEGVAVSASRETLIDYVKNHVVDGVLINLPDSSERTLALARELLDMGVTVHISMEDVYQQLPNRAVGDMFGYQVLTASISAMTWGQTVAKRIIDIAGGIVGCLITALLIPFVGSAIYIASPGPIFFTQTRVGKRGRKFKMYKFRSMYMDAEARKQELMEKNKISDGLMFKIDDDPRIIKGVGHFIRKTSIDEFPQFWNVLKGDMSLVGTRPPTLDEYLRYSPHHKRRLAMAPGITGMWQISGRSSITDFEEVVRLDTEYIENWSLTRDFKIIAKTVLRVLNDDSAF